MLLYVKRTAQSFLITGFVICMISCAAPGAPKLRVDARDGQGELIPGCNNVSTEYRVEKYQDNSYLTTWGSAWSEGAMEGKQEALEKNADLAVVKQFNLYFVNDANKLRTFNQFDTNGTKNWIEKVNHLSQNPLPYCRSYNVPFEILSKVTLIALKKLPHQIIQEDTKLGIFQTDFMQSEHMAARWRDNYLVSIDADGDSKSIVRIFRNIYISRSAKNVKKVFNQGVSVGYNEAWLMTQIADTLADSNLVNNQSRPESNDVSSLNYTNSKAGTGTQEHTIDAALAVNGYGPLLVGMTYKQVQEALNGQISRDVNQSEDCFYATPTNWPKGLNLMFTNSGVLSRIDVLSSRYKSVSGAQVGQSQEELIKRYAGKLFKSTHKYDENGFYFSYVPKDNKDANFRMVFETDGKLVRTFHSGKIPEVNYIEGCL